MRLPLRVRLVALALPVAFTLAGAANARLGLRPGEPAPIASERVLVEHYRAVTWTYERAAHLRRTPSSFSERRSTDRAALQLLVATWTRRAYAAQRSALAAIHRRLLVRLPRAPRLHARLYSRVSYSRRLTLSLRRIYPGHVSRAFARAQAPTAPATLRLWQRRGAVAALEVSEHGLALPASLHDSFICIHRFEGAWNSNTGNGYFGGLQMDRAFQSRYGPEFLGRWGTADNWPTWAQLEAAARAYRSGRGFAPWLNTARFCGLS